MNKTKDYFLQEFRNQMKFNKRFAHSNIGYGEDVMPILELFNRLSSPDEKTAFKEALEALLGDSDSEKRNFAVDICVGFFVFRNAIGK